MHKSHTDREYASHLRNLRETLLRMFGYVDEMLDDATRAVVDGDLELSSQVIKRDAHVDRLESEADERCILILARWHPVASDLRFVTLALKMVTDLERIGDLAVNIAERVPDLSQGAQPWNWDGAAEMAQVCRAMLKTATEALIELDTTKAQAVMGQDEQLDALYRQMFKAVFAGMQERPEFMELGIHALSIAKWLERAGDHITNLGEQVIFLVRGEDVRHNVWFDVDS